MYYMGRSFLLKIILFIKKKKEKIGQEMLFHAYGSMTRRLMVQASVRLSRLNAIQIYFWTLYYFVFYIM